MSRTVKRLSRDDWTAAARVTLAQGGPAAVAVEPIAAQLGSTKGSFYWHFADRGELLQSALDHWERTETEAVIDQLAALPTPPERLIALLRLILIHAQGELSVRLAGWADHPAVAPVLGRVTRRRIGYVAEQLIETGVDPGVAHRRATLAYAAYVGWSQLRQLDHDHEPTATGAATETDPQLVELYVTEFRRLLDI